MISAIVKLCTLTLFLIVMVTQYLQRATFVKNFFQLKCMQNLEMHTSHLIIKTVFLNKS